MRGSKTGKQKNISPLVIENFESVTGLGLRAKIPAGEVALGKRDWFAAGPHRETIARVPTPDTGHSEVWVTAPGLAGRLVLRDEIRPQSAGVIADLRANGLRSVVLTGDHKPAAAHLQQQVRVDEVRAELRPEQKVEAIQQLAREHGPVARARTLSPR